jgi:hypothetical protein
MNRQKRAPRLAVQTLVTTTQEAAIAPDASARPEGQGAPNVLDSFSASESFETRLGTLAERWRAST